MTKAADTLLGVCLARAYMAEVGVEAATDNATSKWVTTRAMLRVTPLGSRVAAYVVLWATLQDELGRDDLTVEDFIATGYMSRRTAYRRNHEFRQLWPEFEYPNALGRLLLDAAARDKARPSMNTLVAA